MTSSGMPRSARIVRRTPLSAGSCSSSEPTPLGSASVRRLSMRMAMCGAWAALAKVLSTSPERCDLERHEVEGLAVEPGLVGDVVHRGGHVVDRHDVRVAELEADEREPLRQRVARLLDRLEEVVGPVDLVHLAGLRVADDDRRAVDAPRDARLLARDLLGVELRAGGRTTAASGPRRTCPRGTGPCSEPVTATDEAWCRMPASSALASATALRVPVTLARSLASSVGGHVVDGGEVEEVVDLAAVLVDPGLLDAEALLREVADDRA